MAPFIIHGKDRGENLRGLTAGVLQGMEMRRQWDQDELAKKQDRRQQALHSLNLQVAEKDLMLKSAAVRKADLQNEAMELRKGFADRKRTMQSTLSRGPGVKGKLAEPSQMQRSAMSRLRGIGADIAGLDTQFQGVAVAPAVVQAMENFEREAKFMEEEWGRTMFDRKPEDIKRLKEDWYADKAESLTTVMKTAERRLIEDYFDDPMMQPGQDERTRGVHFDGLDEANWQKYSLAYNKLLTDYRNDTVSHHDVLMGLENAETQLFTDLYQDRKSTEMQVDLKELGVMDLARGAKARSANEMEELTAADVALIDALDEWDESNKIDAPFSKKANAYLGLVELASAQKLGLTNELVAKRRDQLTKEANADNERAAYQNTISYFRYPEQQTKVKGLFAKAVDDVLEGKTLADLDMATVFGDIIGTVEHSLDGITYDTDVYTDILDELFSARAPQATASGDDGDGGEVVEEPVADATEARARLRRSDDANLKPYRKTDNDINHLHGVAAKRWQKAETPEEKEQAYADVWREAGYNPNTIPADLKAQANEWPHPGVADKLVSGEDKELKRWLTSKVGGNLSSPAAEAFIVRNKESIKQAIIKGIQDNKYDRTAGFWDGEWEKLLEPLFVADANRKTGDTSTVGKPMTQEEMIAKYGTPEQLEKYRKGIK